MGMDVGDYENNGQFDLIVGNFTNEMIALFGHEGFGLVIAATLAPVSKCT